MRLTLLTLATIVAAAPAAAQDYRFTREIAPGGRLEIENINGAIEVTRASGRTAEVTVTKTVKKGDGTMVKAIMETGRGMRVCTIYTNRNPNRTTCDGDNNNSSKGRDNFDVDMHYMVKVPAGAKLSVDDVNGSITITGVDVDGDSKVATVNGDIHFDGTGPSSMETVNGSIFGTFGRATWEGTIDMQTVNGSVELTFPAGLSAELSGETVNGSVQSDFPITIEKGFGPKSFSGRIGAGGRKLRIETVNGGITLRKR